MCLFAINRERTQPCNHPECVEFYKLVSKFCLSETSPVDNSNKRQTQGSEICEYERPSKIMSGKIEVKGPIGPFVPKLTYKEERGDTLFLPNEEYGDSENKSAQQQVDLHRNKFRESMTQNKGDQHLVPSFHEENQSSNGMLALNRAANAPSQYQSKNMQYNPKIALFRFSLIHNKTILKVIYCTCCSVK